MDQFSLKNKDKMYDKFDTKLTFTTSHGQITTYLDKRKD